MAILLANRNGRDSNNQFLHKFVFGRHTCRPNFLRYDRKWKCSPRATLRDCKLREVLATEDGRSRTEVDPEGLVYSSGHYQALSQHQRRLLSHVKTMRFQLTSCGMHVERNTI